MAVKRKRKKGRRTKRAVGATTVRRRRRRKGGAKRGKSDAAKSTLGSHSFGGRKFGCYGKRVRAGRSKGKVARVFCAKLAG